MRPHPTDDRSGTPADTAGVARFGARALLSVATLALGAAAFLLLWLLVRRSRAPLQDLDDGVAEDLNALVSGSLVVAFVVITVVLLVRGQRRLVVLAAATGVGVAVLVPLTTALVDRARPVLDAPWCRCPPAPASPAGTPWARSSRCRSWPSSSCPPCDVARGPGWWRSPSSSSRPSG